MINKEIGRLESKRTSGDHPDYSIKNSQNSKKSMGDLRGSSVAQTPVKDHQLKLV